MSYVSLKKKKIIRRLLDYLIITLGSLIYAAGISLFLDPNKLAPGGVSGIAIIISELTGFLQTGTLIIIMNIPIMILGVRKFGFRFLCSTVYALLVSSLFMNILDLYVGSITEDLLLSSIAGGALVSAGIGIVFRRGATTGGTDVIVRLLRLRFRYLNTGTLFLIVDGVIVLISGIIFKDINIALYAGISLLISMYVLNVVLYGSDGARIIYIISPKKDVIAKRIMEELDSGVTELYGRGAYTGNEKEVLMCVIRMRQLPEASDIVRQEDKSAFMIVSSATAVFGEGYKAHDSEQL